METLKCKVRDLYELRALLLGLSVKNEKTGGVNTLYTGFVNEVGLSEGLKRLAFKASRLINAELEGIDNQRKKIAEEVFEGLDEEQTKAKREAKDLELLNDELSMEIEKIDFTRIESMSFPNNYSVLYEHVFKNY